MQPVHPVMPHHPSGYFDADGRSEAQKNTFASPEQQARTCIFFLWRSSTQTSGFFNHHHLFTN
jgi:predicted cupin superfamily sugar epimerase